MRYRVKVKILGDHARPEWAPGKAINPEKPQGTYVGVSSTVQAWVEWMEQWGDTIDYWSERVR